MKYQLGAWQLPKSWLKGQELLEREWKTEGNILWPHQSMRCLDLCTAVIPAAWRAAMEAVQGLLKGGIWTQNGVSAAQLNGNMYLPVWKGTGERRGRALWGSECCGEGD